MLIGYSPIRGSARTTLQDGTVVEIQAATNTKELSSGKAAVVGVYFDFDHITASLGVGYGTWFIPGLLLPVGHHIPIAELDFHVRF